MATYSFSDIKSDVHTFLSPIFSPEPSLSPLFTTGFGPEPEESDDTSAILRASSHSDDDVTFSDPLTTDVSSSLSKAQTAESFVFLRPSEPNLFGEDTGDITGDLEDTASPLQETLGPDDAPFPRAIEHTNPHLKGPYAMTRKAQLGLTSPHLNDTTRMMM